MNFRLLVVCHCGVRTVVFVFEELETWRGQISLTLAAPCGTSKESYGTKNFLISQGESKETVLDGILASVGLVLKYQVCVQHFVWGNQKTVTPGPRTPTRVRVRGLPMDRSTDYPYGPPLRTTPQNRIKIRNRYFTCGLSNRFLVPAKFRVLHCANVINTTP